MTNQEAIERLQMILVNETILYMMNEKDEEAVHYAIKALEEQPNGEWGDVFHHQGFNYHKCSNCHIAMKVSDYDNYCPNCGADMRGDV